MRNEQHKKCTWLLNKKRCCQPYFQSGGLFRNIVTTKLPNFYLNFLKCTKIFSLFALLSLWIYRDFAPENCEIHVEYPMTADELNKALDGVHQTSGNSEISNEMRNKCVTRAQQNLNITLAVTITGIAAVCCIAFLLLIKR